MKRENILGYPVIASGVDACNAQIIEWVINGDRAYWFACLNPHSAEVAEKDAAFKQALLNADLLVPDGVGVTVASRLLSGSIRDRVTGSDVFSGVSQRLDQQGGSVFFLGSTDAVLSKIVARMAMDYPNVDVVGSYSPPFKSEFTDEDNTQMIEAINQAKPDVLWVGLTAPKQEKWLYANMARLDIRFAGAVGAVFDFYAGTVKRSHPLFQKLGLEWLPRLLQEPRRLWRRNLVSNPRFMLRVLKARLFG